jgi:putative molybdopterin biosynthesis protein
MNRNSPQVRAYLEPLRKARGLSAAELAERVGVTRQTIYAIESGDFVPNTAVALRLARALDVTVEELFAVCEPEEKETVKADLLSGVSGAIPAGPMVRMCRVNERLVAVPAPAFPVYLPVADGIVSQISGGRASIHPFGDVPPHDKRLLIAGCDPALSVLAEALRSSGIEMIGVPCSSRRALDYLRQGVVHAAGSHLRDPETGDYNLPLIKELFPNGGVRLVTFAVWEQGLVLAPGNPKNIRSVADVADKRAVLVNREKGSGSRDLLDTNLRQAGIAGQSIAGYEDEVEGHLTAAYAVAGRRADCCIATRSAARRFGLDFIPLSVERFDLAVPQASLETPGIKAVFDLLNRGSVKHKLQALAGYDTAQTGKMLL